MLTRIRTLSRRLYTRAQAAYLRFLISEAEKDACVIQAEALAAPARLIKTRAYITDLRNRADALEAQP